MTNLCLDLDVVLLAVALADASLTTVTGLGGRVLLGAFAIMRGFFFFLRPMTMPPDFFMVHLLRCWTVWVVYSVFWYGTLKLSTLLCLVPHSSVDAGPVYCQEHFLLQIYHFVS